MKKAVLQQHRIKPSSTFNDSINAATGIEIIKGVDVESINAIKHKRTGHLRRDYKHKDKKCNKCHKVGHLKYACKNKNRIVGAINEDSTSNEVSESISVEDSEGIFTVVDKDMKNGKISIKLNNTKKKVLLDTGACQSLINEGTWRSIGAPKLEKKAQILRDFNGNELDLIGESEIEFVYKKSKVIAKVNVVRGDKQDLIGRDIIKRLKIDLNSIFYGKENGILNVETEDDVRSKIKLMYPNLFAEGLGTYTGELIKIQLRDDAVPKVISYRCNNLNLKDKIRNEIERLVKLDVWEPINSSEWISPMSVALKSNGNVRICANFSQTINKVVDNEQFQIPTPHKLFARIEGCAVFSNFDISDAFLSIVIDPQCRKYLVVSTPIGLMQYKRLPFGLSSSPMIFQRIMTNLLQDIDGVAVYFDDVVVGGKDVHEHDIRMHKVLDKLEVSGFKLNVTKSAIRKNQIKYLGHIIDKNSITPDPQKTKAIKEMRKPTNLNELKSFLGMVIHYAKFIPKLSIIAKPLNELTKKNRKFEFNDDCRRSFEALKEVLSSNKVLVPYSRKIPVIFASDASQYGYGAVVMHRFDDGSEKPIEYVSKTFNEAQVNYSQIEKECCAITDSLPLKFLLSPDTSLPNVILRRIDRWACQLKRFQFKTEYINTKFFGKVDGLSRLPLNENQNWELNDTEKSSIRVISEAPVDIDKVRVETVNDKVLREILKYLRNGWPKNLSKKLKEYGKIKFNLAENDGIIMKNEQIIIPLSLQSEVLRMLHSGHVGIVRMKMLARSNVFWMGMNKQIENVTKKCETCMKIGIPESNVNLHPWEPAKEIFEKLHIDMCGPLDNVRYLVIYDMFTGYPFVERLRNGDSQEIIDILDRIFIDFMYPSLNVSDNGTNFVSEKIRRYYDEHGIRYLTSAPYHPQSNGAAENLVKKFKTVYFKLLKDGHSPKNAVKIFLKTNRNVANTRTHESPYEKMFNKKFKLIKESSRKMENRIKRQNDFVKSKDKMSDRVVIAKKESSRRSNKCDMNKDDGKKTIDKADKRHSFDGKVSKSNVKEFKENEKVWEKTKNIKEWNKATVVKRMGTNMYKVYTEHRSEPQLRHTDQLRKRKSPIGTIRRSERISKKPRRCYAERTRGGAKVKANVDQ
uniref:RNA-directed DNA polymerase n=1 Tax=Strongyloides papillosus TaxID=174720 RepID=A0A0N5BN48_STREA